MKNHLLLNQLFGTVGSPNQTDETLTRENRIGLMSYLRRTLMLLFAMLTLACGNVWGATHTVTPNIGGTQYEIYNIYSNSSAYAFFSNATTIRSAYSSWVSGQLSSKSDAGATAISGWLATGSGKPGYGKGFVNNSKTVTMTVTNCIEVAFVSKSGGGSRTSNLSVKLNGVEVGSVATNGNSYAAVTYGTALDASKTYTITLSGSTSDNCEVDQIRFKAPAVCSAALGGTTSNPSATVGESAGTISCTVNNGAAKTATSYQWYKNTSKSTSGATSISGATSSTYSPNEASAGTYYYYCTVQTAQITTDGADAARITSGISDAFVFTAAPAGSGWGIASSDNSYNASADEMSGSGTVSKTLSLSANADLQFKIVNISGNTWYGNGEVWGGTKTQSVSSTGTANNCHLLTTEAGNYTFSFNTSTKDLTITYPNSYTFYYANTGSWSKVYVYKFTSNGSTGNNAAWPGVEIASPTYTCGGTDYYATTSDGYAKLIFTNNGGGDSNQTSDMVVSSSDAGKYTSGNKGAGTTTWTAFLTYTITFAANGGSSSMSNISSIACGSDQKITANGYGAPSGYQFAGWKANVAVTIDDETVSAGTIIADQATLQNISSDITLTAQWELIPTYDVIYNTNGGTGGSTASQTGNLSGAQVTTSANGFTKTGYKFKWWNTAANGSGEDFYPGEKVTIASADVNLYAQWEQVNSGWEFWCGSPNAFTTDQAVVGDMVLTKGGANVAINTDLTADPTIVSKYNSSVDKHAICIAVPNNDQYIQVSFSDGSPINTLKLWATTNKTESKNLAIIYSTTADFSTGEYEAKTVSVPASNAASKALTDFSPATADKYFYARIYRKVETAVYGFTGGSGNTARIYGVKAQKGTICTAPSALAAASPTAKGATLTVTDANDVNNYEFYVSTESTAPEAGATATHSVSSAKSLTITNLVAGTTYYAWARSVCGVSNKSGWTALTGNTFTTSTVTMTPTLTNVTHTSGATSGIGGSNYTAVFTANTGYSMPNPTVTIGGNAATSGTDYTWSVDGSVGTITIPANKINGNIVITLNSVPSAPSSAVISGTYHYFPGENISLTCTPSGNNGPTTYQWYKGGKENGNAIEGATSATYTKNSCTFDDAGSYYCKVTCNATSIWAVTNSHENYDVKILRLYVNGSKGGDPYGNVDFVKVDGTTATASISLGSNWTYGFNIADGCGHYYGNSGTMQYNNYGPWVTNVDGTDCGLTTTNAATYIFTINYSNLSSITTTVTFPVANQAAGKVIYFDNNVLKWTGSSIYYRIGHSSHTQADQLSLVPGTANLYKMTTREYNNFSAWQIGNAAGDNGSGKSIYNTKNSPAITASTAYEGGAVTDASVTVTPGEDHSTGGTSENNNCEFYSKTITNGMKTDNVAISDYSNGTITVNYTNTSGSAATLTSGNADLAHTVILTSITAVPNTGYDASAITINGGAYSANYVVTGATTIAASFTPQVYNITYKDQGNVAFSGVHADGYPTTHTYGSTTALKGATKAGYTFGGWFGNPECTGAALTSILGTSYTADFTLYAKWTVNTYDVADHTLSNVTLSSGGTTGAGAATYGTNYTATFAADAGYDLPSDVTVQIGGETKTKGTEYTWNSGTGVLTINGSYILGNIAITITGEEACEKPTAPASLGAEDVIHNSARLVWDGGSAGANGYKIKLESATGAGTFGWTDCAEAVYDATGLTESTTYTFYVKYKGTGGQCEFSNEVSVEFTTTAPTLTALKADVLYQAADMANITFTGSDQHFTGVSTNSKFEVHGTLNSTDAFGKNENHNVTDDIDTKNFTSAAYITAANNTDKTDDPSQGAIEILTPSTTGKLYIYLANDDSKLTLKKHGVNENKSLSGAAWKAMDVDVSTHYFIQGYGSKRGIYGVKYVSTYNVSITPTNITKATGETGSGAAIKGKDYTATFTAPAGYTLPSDVTWLTIGGDLQTKGTGYTWTISSGTATLTVPAAYVTGNIVVHVAGVAATTYDVDFSLTNVAYSSGDNEGTDAATEGVEFSTVFAASSGYTLPGTITVTIGGAAQTEGTGYTWAEGTGTLTIPAAKVTGNIVVTIVGEEIEGDGCEELVHTEAATATTLSTSVGTATVSNPSSQSANNKAIKLNSSGYIELSPKAGKSFAAGDSLVVVMWNQASSAKTTGYRIAGTDYTASMPSKVNTTFRRKLIAADIVSSKVKIERESDNGSNAYFVSAIIKHCEDLPSCTTPTLPTLSNQTVCPGSDIAAWDATPTNIATITAASEDVAYSWKKKGSDTEIEDEAELDLGSSATEGQAGTYVVTVTVSKTGYITKSASAEVDLTVTPATEEPSVTASKATVYAGNSVTLTATCGSTGVTWAWYTCTNAAGDGESVIAGQTTNAYAIASAPAAGTYYYKVKATGDGTNSCGVASHVYTLTVSPAAGGDCFHFVSVIPASDFNASSGASLVTPTHATTLEGGTMKVGSQQVTFTKDYGLKMESSKTVSITLDAALEAGNVVIVKGTSGTKGYGITINGVNFYDADNKTFDVSYTVLADDGLEGQTALTVSKYSGSSYLQEVKITGCGESCTDPEVTASADNTTACASSSVTFTATGAHAEATYQWQKLDGTWTNISDETASTYTIASVVAGDAGKYRVIATHDCSRTSNEVTLSVPSAPDFGSTVPASVSVMQTIALSINTVEATDAVKYRWYKSADATWDAGDVEIGTNKELIKAYDSEAIGSPSYYIFCRAQNACDITTSDPIAVNVTAYVEEDCATRGNEGDAAFSFENSGCGQGSYQSANCWTMNSNSKILVYYPPTGKYFKTAKVTIASSSESKASYNWSTNGGTDYTAVSLTVSSTLTERTIDLSAHGNVNAFQIGRNFDSKGSSGGTLYVSKICFEYTDACTATTVTPSESSKTYEMDGSSFTEPTFTVKHGGTAFDPQPTLTYTSSNEDIASVDDDGTVTFNGEAGTVTITASYAGGTISATDYCASSGSYTINVSCPGGAPKVVASGTTVGCSSSITLQAKQSDGTSDFADGTYQWFRNGEEIDDATNSSYTATQAGTYTVSRTKDGCTSPSSNSAVVTSVTTEPEVERLVPFQYYHVDKTYSDQMKMRHLFAVKNSGKLDGKSFKMYVSRNGGAATDVTSSNALVVWPNGDGHVDTVMVDLNKLSGKYSEDDELVFTCKAIDCSGNVSDVYKETITMNVIGATPTLALICSGSSKAGGTRKTGELTVGGDFLTGYNVADLCEQTGSTSFDANTEWGLYTDLKTQYIVTPVNGYAVFNKLNYEPFDILLLTDYPKASKSDAAKDVLDDMAALCDYRPMLSFKTHMVAKSPSKWAEKGFTTSPVVTKADGRLNLNIVCYAHPMFEGLKTGDDVYTDVGNTSAPLVYTMLSGAGHESGKGMQGFELAAAENFVTIGLTHYNGTITKDSPDLGEVEWTPGSEDRMLVTVAERQANPEARFILFSLNCGAQSKLTDKGEEVVLACLNYLLGTAEGTIAPADCSFTFDNGDNNEHDAAWYASNCPLCTGTKGDGLWTTAANWGPDYRLLPGEFTSVRIKKPVEVNDEHAHVMEVRIIDGGSVDIPAGKALDVKSTIRRMDGSEIYPTEEGDIHIGSASTGNGTLIFNNDEGDTKARVDMYSKGFIDYTDPSKPKGIKNYQYIGTPFNEVNALYNYYGSWIYYWKADGSGWKAVKNGGPMTAWTGYCISQESPTYYETRGTMTATGSVDIAVPAGKNMVIGNSWTAPISIKDMTTDDFENLTANIYFFNTGVDKTGEGAVNTKPTGATRWAGGTYVSIPINSAPYTDTDDHIPSMQGFFVKSPSAAGTLHLDYDKHVRGTTRSSIVGGALHAPARRTNAESDEPEVLKIKVSGENYDDKLVLLAREDFSTGFDNGWDGDKWDGNESALYIYTTDSEGTENSVSAAPELEGTIIGFRAGEDDAYTLNFEYLNSNEDLYLYDAEINTYTQIMTGATYRFFTADKSKHARFIITRKNPQIGTGVESADDGSRTKARKLIIEDKMYILVNGMLYDATGKVVK